MDEVRGRGVVRSVDAVLDALDEELRRGQAHELVPVPTGFTPLDTVLGGGLHPGALTVLGGGPGVGKTVMALQWARRMAADGRDVLFVCYEHDEAELLMRLLVQELVDQPADVADRVRETLVASASTAGASVRQVLAEADVGGEAVDALKEIGPRLHLVRASGAHTGLAEIEAHLDEIGAERPVLFVDYLQKIAIDPAPPNEDEKVTLATEGLKDLALSREIPVVAIVAVSMTGLKEGRLRMHHFRGSSALVFEADVALVLNSKEEAVAKVHLAYDPVRAETFRRWVVVSVEKNRAGPSLVDLEFRKDFVHFRFDPQGDLCRDKLADDRFDVD